MELRVDRSAGILPPPASSESAPPSMDAEDDWLQVSLQAGGTVCSEAQWIYSDLLPLTDAPGDSGALAKGGLQRALHLLAAVANGMREGGMELEETTCVPWQQLFTGSADSRQGCQAVLLLASQLSKPLQSTELVQCVVGPPPPALPAVPACGIDAGIHALRQAIRGGCGEALSLADAGSERVSAMARAAAATMRLGPCSSASVERVVACTSSNMHDTTSSLWDAIDAWGEAREQAACEEAAPAPPSPAVGAPVLPWHTATTAIPVVEPDDMVVEVVCEGEASDDAARPDFPPPLPALMVDLAERAAAELVQAGRLAPLPATREGAYIYDSASALERLAQWPTAVIGTIVEASGVALQASEGIPARAAAARILAAALALHTLVWLPQKGSDEERVEYVDRILGTDKFRAKLGVPVCPASPPFEAITWAAALEQVADGLRAGVPAPPGPAFASPSWEPLAHDIRMDGVEEEDRVLPATVDAVVAAFLRGQLPRTSPLTLRVLISEALLQDSALLIALSLGREEGGAGLELMERALPVPLDLMLDDSTAVSVLQLRTMVLVHQPRAPPPPAAGSGRAGGGQRGAAPPPPPPALSPPEPCTAKWQEYIRGLAKQAPRLARVHIVVDTTGCDASPELSAASALALHRMQMSAINFDPIAAMWAVAAGPTGVATLVRSIVDARALAVGRAAAGKLAEAEAAGGSAVAAALDGLRAWVTRDWLDEAEGGCEVFLASLGSLSPYTAARVAGMFDSPAAFLACPQHILRRVLGDAVPSAVADNMLAVAAADTAGETGGEGGEGEYGHQQWAPPPPPPRQAPAFRIPRPALT